MNAFYGVRHHSSALHILAHLILARTMRWTPLQMKNLRCEDVKPLVPAHGLQEEDPGVKPGSLASDPGLETTIVSLHMFYYCFLSLS